MSLRCSVMLCGVDEPFQSIMLMICNVQLDHNRWCLETNPGEGGWLSCWCVKAFCFWLFPIFCRGMLLVEATSLVNESYCGLAKSGSAAEVIYIWFHTYGGGTRTGGIFACRETKVFKGWITWGRSGSFQSSPHLPVYILCCFWKNKDRKLSLKNEGGKKSKEISIFCTVLINTEKLWIYGWDSKYTFDSYEWTLLICSGDMLCNSELCDQQKEAELREAAHNPM